MQKTLKHDEKLNYLIDKGMEIMWSKGYNGTSVNDIVKAADVPKGSFYFYFDSKEDFAVKAIEKYFNAMFIPANEILKDKAKSPLQRLLDFNSYRIDFLKNEMDCQRGCMACNLGNEMSEHNEKIRTAISVKNELMLSIITEVIQEAKDLGEIKNPMKASDIAAFIEDAGKGAMITMKEVKNSYPIDNVKNMIEQLLLQ